MSRSVHPPAAWTQTAATTYHRIRNSPHPGSDRGHYRPCPVPFIWLILFMDVFSPFYNLVFHSTLACNCFDMVKQYLRIELIYWLRVFFLARHCIMRHHHAFKYRHLSAATLGVANAHLQYGRQSRMVVSGAHAVECSRHSIYTIMVLWAQA
jgi:hypothetical protein